MKPISYDMFHVSISCVENCCLVGLLKGFIYGQPNEQPLDGAVEMGRGERKTATVNGNYNINY